ncbi:Hypothetical protein FKW44_014551 [Caligus rogercresseyi]|uniref:Uncharacterized protein n=1 Tax=Caligus rogercresseyi TaxID=217165 RepID=A0A7T8GZR9_CALRO|nr:Hypothetical protein FKW44_014551 [Caligus rogercresseyi]
MTRLAAARDVSIYTISKAVREDLGTRASPSGINQEVYLEVMRDVVVPWMNKAAKGGFKAFCTPRGSRGTLSL